ncbi:KlaA protein [Clostridia bacterium]|nr:KlaA protein [Clostridia bacterium]
MGFNLDVALETPKPEAIEAEVKQEIATTPEQKTIINSSVIDKVESIFSLNEDDVQGRREIEGVIGAWGAESIKQSSDKNSLISVSIGKLSKNGGTGGEVSKNLVELDKNIRTLDPSGVSFTDKGIFGKLFSPVKDYFKKYEKIDDVISGIVANLEDGKKTLKNDNITLELERGKLRELAKKLTVDIDVGMAMDEEITRRLAIAKENGEPPEKIKFIEEEVLYSLRQRVSDMQQLVVVNHQGIIAMEVVRRNNSELIRGVDRAKNVTVTALRTAVMVASALYNQKIVLEKLQALDKTTNDIIASTSKMLREQGTAIQRQSLESGVSPETLRTAFSDVMAALDDISRFKQESLPVMQQRIAQFRELADKGEVEIKRLEKGSANKALQTGE